MSWFTKIFGHKQENPYSPAELPERQEEKKLPAAIESTTNLVPNTVVPSTTTPVVKPVTRELPMMECPPFPGNASCSDNDCPCPNTTMPPAKGYLWVKPEVADTRMKCLSLAALDGYMTASGISSIDEIRRRCLPIVVCEQAAKRRNLDLAVAASDYGSWVKTGKVPCRATPLVTSESAPAVNIRSSSAPTLNIGDVCHTEV